MPGLIQPPTAVPSEVEAGGPEILDPLQDDNASNNIGVPLDLPESVGSEIEASEGSPFKVPEVSKDDQEVVTKLNTRLNVIEEFKLLGFRPNGERTTVWDVGRWRDTGLQVDIHIPSTFIKIEGYGQLYSLFEFASMFCGFVSTSAARHAYAEKIKAVVSGTCKDPVAYNKTTFPEDAQATAKVPLPEKTATKHAIATPGPVSDDRELKPTTTPSVPAVPSAAAEPPDIVAESRESGESYLPARGGSQLARIRVAHQTERKAHRTMVMARMCWEEGVEDLANEIAYDGKPGDPDVPDETERKQIEQAASDKPFKDVTLAEMGVPSGVAKAFGAAGLATAGDLAATGGASMENYKEFTKKRGIGEAKAATVRDAYLACQERRQAEAMGDGS